MLINATHTDEIRVAIADGQKLFDLDIDSAGHNRKKGNIYKARVTRVEPSLEACFVNYGSERHGFLPYKEINPSYYKKTNQNHGKGRPPINEVISEGDELIIQVNKEERGNKGAALSTYISLAGRYLVYMPGNRRAGGISRQIKGNERTALQDKLNRLEIPKNDGIIIRTAGLGRDYTELEWDFNYLKQVWSAIQDAANKKSAPFFIYQESDLFIRAIRDYLQPDIGEILIDDKPSYEKAREFMQQVMPHNLKKLSYYNDNTPLFSRYQIERQIQSAFEREVKLPSGGSLVIDHTEAMISIDINSAKATKGSDVESTALNTNLESADEIARQLRIRDLGGLVVIDFIDMRNQQNQRAVEERMRDATSIDRARVQMGKISRFGLMEMSRQRLRSSINDSSQVTCPTCSGHGFIRSQESLVISIIRLTEEEMIKPYTGKVIIQAPVEIANAILNDKRTELSDLESRHSVQLAVISNEHLSSPNFHVQRYKQSEANINISDIELVKPEDCNTHLNETSQSVNTETPILETVVPDVQAPNRSFVASFISWIKMNFGGKPKKQNKSRKSPNNNKNQYRKNSKKTTPKRNIKQKNHTGQKTQQKSVKRPTTTHNRKTNSKNAQKPITAKKHNTTTVKKNTIDKRNVQKNHDNNSANTKKTAKNVQQKRKPATKSNQKNTTNKHQKPNRNNVSSVNNQKVAKANQKPANNNNKNKSTNIKKNLMDRPLGSVAELANKKPQLVPSGAKPSDKTPNEANVKPANIKNRTEVTKKEPIKNNTDFSQKNSNKNLPNKVDAKKSRPKKNTDATEKTKISTENNTNKQSQDKKSQTVKKEQQPVNHGNNEIKPTSIEKPKVKKNNLDAKVEKTQKKVAPVKKENTPNKNTE